MKVLLVTPAPPGSRKGNRVTALRWARLLRDLGHRVRIGQAYQGERADLLVALHARQSFPSIARWRRDHPAKPLVVALTGTDLYHDLRESAEARRALELADRIVVLQPLGVRQIPRPLRRKARAILQSAERPSRRPPRSRRTFDVCVLGHLRPVKDPLRAAIAARLLPASSRIRIVQVGAALSPEMEAAARAEEAENPRYHWLGELPRWKALRVLSRSRLLALTSLLEGGANVVSEAIVSGVPVVSSRIPGSAGQLGAGYPGFFPPGDSAALARLLERAEEDPRFYARLRRWCARLAPRFSPARERRAWGRLLRELGG